MPLDNEGIIGSGFTNAANQANQLDIRFARALADNAHQRVHEQLLKNENIYRLNTIADMQEQRIGGINSNRRCYYRYANDANTYGGKHITAGIFVDLRVVKWKEGVPLETQLPGDIDQMLNTPVNEDFFPLQLKPDEFLVGVFYTISNGQALEIDGQKIPLKGEGRALASNVYETLIDEFRLLGIPFIPTTLSPIVGMSEYFAKTPALEHLVQPAPKDDPYAKFVASDTLMEQIQTPEGQRFIQRYAQEYIFTERDPVAGFHLGNGGYLGDLKFNPSNRRHFTMVNYVYHPDAMVLQNNSNIFNIGNGVQKRYYRPISEHQLNFLEKELPELTERAKVVPLHATHPSAGFILPSRVVA